MAALGYNQTFPIYNQDGTAFHGLVLHKSTVESVVMSLGDKISGDVYYKDNTLAVTMQEYIVYNDVHYQLVSPPTVVREGMVSDNNDLKGMTRYSFVFYHPMYQLSSIPFTDIAVTLNEEKYLSQNKTFSWIGNLTDFVAKLNKNLQGTQWLVSLDIHGASETQKAAKLSDVISFDKQFISDALKTAYDTWEIPFVITSIVAGETGYSQGKRFLVSFGLPSQEIYQQDGETPFVFQFGKGVGLKNNSRTPRNNKIVTRIVGNGAERNIPYGYPQIVWTGNPDWNYTVNNDSTAANSYPIYDGIVGGQRVRLIKHPFTRTRLMPSIYVETVNKKVNPNATGYDPSIEIKDYYDAPNNYPNPFNAAAPSVEIHEFDDIYPELGNAQIVSAVPWDAPTDGTGYVYVDGYISWSDFYTNILSFATNARTEREYDALMHLLSVLTLQDVPPIGHDSFNGGSYTFQWDYTSSADFFFVKYISDNVNFDYAVLKDGHTLPTPYWNDTMDDDGNYVQSYFKITLPMLSFDLYASASITEQMDINMRSGACIGCTFPIQVDWEDYKRNFYDDDGNFAPDGNQRDLDKYPKSNTGSITVLVKKEIETFGTLMPNIYQQPQSGDEFVILGISLPTTYISDAESRLDSAMMEYMLENNVHYYDYPLKFDEYFLATHTGILSQMKNNNIVRFKYGNEPNMALYIKSMTVKFGEGALPQYDITLTDDVEIVLNQIGQVTDDVSRMRVQVAELQKYYGENVADELNAKLSRVSDDIAQGRITFQQGLDALANVVLYDEVKSDIYGTGLYTGRGWRIDHLGNAEVESLKIRSFLEVVELLVNRMQAQEGDTLFTDNDQIDKVEHTDNNTYILSLKEKYDGYVTAQQYGNIIKGVINTLAADQAGISDETNNNPSKQGTDAGGNKYYTSWMRVVATHNTAPSSLKVNQIEVVLYGDNDVPAEKNFEPCELMTIARFGCVDYSVGHESDPDYDAMVASIKQRQNSFYISTSEGRIVKLVHVDKPKLENYNYGTTLGLLPEFVKDYGNVRERVIDGRDYLYAQGVVVGDFIKITTAGVPVPTIVFCDEWVDGSAVQNPTIGNGIYFNNSYNPSTQQYETHEVRHNGGRWQCLQNQPVVVGNTSTYYEPRWNSPYWAIVDGNDNLTIEFVSSRGYSFRRGHVDTTIEPHLFYGNVDITDDVTAGYWSWTRHEERNESIDPQTGQRVVVYTEADVTWNAQHVGVKTIPLTNADMPFEWSSANKAIFTCTVQVNDGKTTRIVDNQIIS